MKYIIASYIVFLLLMSTSAGANETIETIKIVLNSGTPLYGLFLLFLIGTFYWTRKLSKEKKKVYASELKIRSIIENSQDALIVINQKSYVVMWNNAATTTFGYRYDEIIGRSIENIIPQGFKKLHFAGVDRVVNGGEKKLLGKGAIEIEGLHKNGAIIPIDLALNTYTIDDEIFFSANIRDISERKALRLELEEDKKLIDSIINAQESFVLTSDGEMLKSANQAFFDFFNIQNVEEFILKFGNCICDTFNKNASKKYIHKLMGTEKWVDYVYARPNEIHKTIIYKDDKEYIFTITSEKIIFKGEELKVAILTDVTKIEKQKNHLKKFFNNKGSGILIVDSNRKITEVNPKFCEMWGYTEDEIISKNAKELHISQNSFENFGKIAFNHVKNDSYIDIEYQWKRKDGTVFWAKFSGETLSADGSVLWVISDITEIKEAQEELKSEKELINSIMNAQENIVITSDGKTFKTANQAFLDFYDIKIIDEFIDKFGHCICDSFEEDPTGKYIHKDMNGIKWVDYILNNPTLVHKAIIKKGDINHTFTVTVDGFEFKKEKLVTVVFSDITEIEDIKNKIEAMHKHTRESIEYSAIIQSALIPEAYEFRDAFKDYFAYWRPKDTVGGDIYLFEELRGQKEEYLLMYIDCTGHGIPGAFVTMIVKSIEQQVLNKIENDENIEVSPAWIMGYFNKKMKYLLKQEDKTSISNVGWDGGIIYYNKTEKILKFAGAETPLFYIDTDGSFNTIKGNRYSVGYKKCSTSYEYKETTIEVEEGMKFYCTTDGYLDQNGGEKDFPFGKKRFANIIKENHSETMPDQLEIFLNDMDDYEEMVENNDRNDDMTVIGFTI